MSSERDYCEHCGATGRPLEHAWVEDTCVLPHRGHSWDLVPGANVCRPCVARWRDWLAEIVELWAGLSDVLLTGSVADDTAEHGKPQKRPASPSPIRLDAWAMLHPESLNAWVRDDRGVLVHQGTTGLPYPPEVLAAWAQAVYDQQGITAVAPDTVAGAATVLRINGETLARMADVDTYDAELTWVRRALRAAHGGNAPKRLGRCLSIHNGRECGGVVWESLIGDVRARCARCHDSYDGARLARLSIMEARRAR